MINITDHFAIFNIIDLGKNIVKDNYVDISKRIIHTENLSHLSVCISNFNWNYIKGLDNVDKAYREFSDNLKYMFDET